MRISLSVALLTMLYVCQEPWLTVVEGKEKICFSLVEEGRLEALESDVKLIKEMLATKKFGVCVCGRYLVSGVDGVQDSKITASTVFSSDYTAPRARLYDLADRTSRGKGSWAAQTNDNRQYIQVELKGPSKVTGIVTQGRKDANQWVKSYKVLYSNDGVTWKTIQNELGEDQVFTGNSDRTSVVTHHLDWPIIARFVRLHVLTWHGHVSMRFDVLGCPTENN